VKRWTPPDVRENGKVTRRPSPLLRWPLAILAASLASPAGAQELSAFDFSPPPRVQPDPYYPSNIRFTGQQIVVSVDPARRVLVRAGVTVASETSHIYTDRLRGKPIRGLPAALRAMTPREPIYFRVLHASGKWACTRLNLVPPPPRGRSRAFCLRDSDLDGLVDEALAEGQRHRIVPFRLISYTGPLGSRERTKILRRIEVVAVMEDRLVLNARMEIQPGGTIDAYKLAWSPPRPEFHERAMPLRSGAVLHWEGLTLTLQGDRRRGWWLSARGAYPPIRFFHRATRLDVGGTTLELNGHLEDEPCRPANSGTPVSFHYLPPVC